ncbi:MAG TPA: hypothetical protein PLY93_00050 [Turneriella sp.]|nr:hypothetical protein [Turneriella sp.]
MDNLKSEPLIALKGRFRAPNARYYGQFFILINQKNDCIDAAQVLITSNTETYNILKTTDNWKKFESLINRLKYEGKYSQSITSEFQERLKQLTLDKLFFSDLVKAVHGNNENNLKFLVGGFYQRIIKDEEFSIDLLVDKASLNDESFENVGTTSPADSALENGSYLPIKLDLDPISGKDVKQVRPGDKIFVRILPQSDQANAFIDSTGLRSESGFIKSAPFIITSVVYPGVGVELVGKLSDGVYGKIVEEQNVLIRVAETVKKITKPNGQANVSTPQAEKSSILVMAIGVLGIVLLALILYFILAGN